MKKNCKNCGDSFEANKEVQIFCSRSCSIKFRSKTTGFCIKQPFPDSYISYYVDACGKIRRKMKFKEHPNSLHGWVTYSRWVIEKNLGRFLKKGEIVHHIDGNTLNDDPKNLLLLSSRKDHSLIHSKEKGFGEPLLECDKLDIEYIEEIFGVNNCIYLFDEPCQSCWGKKLDIPKIETYQIKETEEIKQEERIGHFVDCYKPSPYYLKRIKENKK